jgi:hypothetical protein
MRFIVVGIMSMMCFEVSAMDIIKTYKVSEDPKPFYHRKMDQAIRVQFSQDAIHQYLKKKDHPCCQH